MISGPLDWPAGPFLQLYMVLAAICAAIMLFIRRELGPASFSSGDRPLELLEIAWLSGGPARAADTVLVDLLAAGAASVDMTKRYVFLKGNLTSVPPAMRAFCAGFTGPATHKEFREAIPGEHGPDTPDTDAPRPGAPAGRSDVVQGRHGCPALDSGSVWSGKDHRRLVPRQAGRVPGVPGDRHRCIRRLVALG
jgi:hypothetical protein